MWLHTGKSSLFYFTLFVFFLVPSFVATHMPEDRALPDLVIKRIAFQPQNPVPGGILRVVVEVKNQGEGGFQGDLDLKLWLGSKGVARQRVETFLEPGGLREFLFRVSLPSDRAMVAVRAEVRSKSEPRDKWGNNVYCTSLTLKRKVEWRLVRIRPSKVEVVPGKGGKVEVWFRGSLGKKRGGLEAAVKFSMLVRGERGVWSSEGKVFPASGGGLVKVVFGLWGLSLPPGYYRGELLVQGRGWSRRFSRGPVIRVLETEEKEEQDYVPREALLVLPVKGGAKERLLAAVRGERGSLIEERKVALLGLTVILVRFPPGWRDYDRWKRKIEGAFPGVRVERNKLFRTLGGSSEKKDSKDPYEELQYYREVLGGGRDEGRVVGEVRVGVVDTGFDYGHEELRGRGIGRWDLAGNRGKTFSREVHGTAVLGVIKAECGNGVGICGLAPFARILYVRACWEEGDRGKSTTFLLLKALDLLASETPHIINMSLGGGYDPLLEMALEAMWRRGVLVVAASSRTQKGSTYPGAFPFVLGVGPLDSQGRPMGKVKADLWAPGEDVFTTFPNNRYGFLSGSSMAAAIVTAEVARLKGVAPSLSSVELLEVVKTAARKEGGCRVMDFRRAVLKARRLASGKGS